MVSQTRFLGRRWIILGRRKQRPSDVKEDHAFLMLAFLCGYMAATLISKLCFEMKFQPRVRKVRFGESAYPFFHHSSLPSFRVAGIENEDEFEDEMKRLVRPSTP